jgi:hypothetical protein
MICYISSIFFDSLSIKNQYALDKMITGAAKSIIPIAQVVQQSVRTSGNFKKFLYRYHTDKLRNASDKNG